MTTTEAQAVVQWGVVVGALVFVYSCFWGTPLSYLRWYRRWRGGRWARTSKNWLRVSDACVERIDEDWR